MLHRTKKKCDANEGKWIGIGGAFEEGESPEECIRREIFEETSLVPEKLKFRGIVTFVSDRYETEYMHLFTCFSQSEKVSSCEEGELKWVSKDKINSLNLWEGDKIFLCDILNSRDSFKFYRLCYDENDNLIAGGEE